MHRALRGFLLLLLGPGLIFLCSTPGTATAATSRSLPTETRGNFIYAVALALGLQPSTQTSPFTDLRVGGYLLGPWITAAAEASWAGGYPDGTFRPDVALTRAMAAKIEVNALDQATAAQALATQKSPFRDDAAIPAWARGYVNEAYKLGIFRGQSNGYFLPNQSLTTYQSGHAILQLDAYVAQQEKKPLPATVSSIQFIEQLTLLLGYTPTVLYVGGTTQPQSLPYLSEGMAYYQAAENGNWLAPLFLAEPQNAEYQPTWPVTRAQALAMAVLARTDATSDLTTELAAALSAKKTPFRDDAAIPAYLRGYVNEALLLGISPWRNGNLAPNAALTQRDSTALLGLAAQRAMSIWQAGAAKSGLPAYIGIEYAPTTIAFDGSPSDPEGSGSVAFGVFDARGQAVRTGTVQVQVANPSIMSVLANTGSKIAGTTQVPVTGQNFTLVSGTSQKSGTTTVTLRDGAATTSLKVTVVRTPLTIRLTPQTTSLYPGQSVKFQTQVQDATGTPFNVKPTISAQTGTVAADGTYTAGSTLGQDLVQASLTLNGQTYQATAQVMTLSHAAKLLVTLQDATTGAAQVTAGDPIKGVVEVETSSGAPVTTSDPVLLSLPGRTDQPIPIKDGKGTFEFTSTAAGKVTATVYDRAAGALHHFLSRTASITVVGGPAVSYSLFDQSGQAITLNHPANLAAGVATALTLEPIDAYGNPTSVSSTTPVTVQLMSSDTTGAFMTSTTGTPASTVTLQPGSSSLPLWYETNATGVPSAVLSAAIAPQLLALPATLSLSAGAGGITGGNFEVVDANGRPVANAPVVMTLGSLQGSDEANPDEGGSGLETLPGEPMSGVTGTDGTAHFTLQTPSGADGDQDFSQDVVATIPGVPDATATCTLTW